jgi:hypothetical protein
VLAVGGGLHADALREQMETRHPGEIEIVCRPTLDRGAALGPFDLLHLISMPLPVLREAGRAGRPLVNHWIGTDVYRFLHDRPLKRWLKKRLISGVSATHLADSENLRIELASLGVSAAVLPLISRLSIPPEPPPLPERFAVLSYLPSDRWDFYHGDLVLEVARRLPDIEFHIAASASLPEKLPNVTAHGFVTDIRPLMLQVSAYLRITVHDALAKLVLESLAYGRHVLWNQDLPHCRRVTNVEECVRALAELRASGRSNLEGHAFVKANYDPGILAASFLALYRRIADERTPLRRPGR